MKKKYILKTSYLALSFASGLNLALASDLSTSDEFASSRDLSPSDSSSRRVSENLPKNGFTKVIANFNNRQFIDECDRDHGTTFARNQNASDENCWEALFFLKDKYKELKDTENYILTYHCMAKYLLSSEYFPHSKNTSEQKSQFISKLIDKIGLSCVSRSKKNQKFKKWSLIHSGMLCAKYLDFFDLSEEKKQNMLRKAFFSFRHAKKLGGAKTVNYLLAELVLHRDYYAGYETYDEALEYASKCLSRAEKESETERSTEQPKEKTTRTAQSTNQTNPQVQATNQTNTQAQSTNQTNPQARAKTMSIVEKNARPTFIKKLTKRVESETAVTDEGGEPHPFEQVDRSVVIRSSPEPLFEPSENVFLPSDFETPSDSSEDVSFHINSSIPAQNTRVLDSESEPESASSDEDFDDINAPDEPTIQKALTWRARKDRQTIVEMIQTSYDIFQEKIGKDNPTLAGYFKFFKEEYPNVKIGLVPFKSICQDNNIIFRTKKKKWSVKERDQVIDLYLRNIDKYKSKKGCCNFIKKTLNKNFTVRSIEALITRELKNRADQLVTPIANKNKVWSSEEAEALYKLYKENMDRFQNREKCCEFIQKEMNLNDVSLIAIKSKLNKEIKRHSEKNTQTSVKNKNWSEKEKKIVVDLFIKNINEFPSKKDCYHFIKQQINFDVSLASIENCINRELQNRPDLNLKTALPKTRIWSSEEKETLYKLYTENRGKFKTTKKCCEFIREEMKLEHLTVQAIKCRLDRELENRPDLHRKPALVKNKKWSSEEKETLYKLFIENKKRFRTVKACCEFIQKEMKLEDISYRAIKSRIDSEMKKHQNGSHERSSGVSQSAGDLRSGNEAQSVGQKRSNPYKGVKPRKVQKVTSENRTPTPILIEELSESDSSAVSDGSGSEEDRYSSSEEIPLTVEDMNFINIYQKNRRFFLSDDDCLDSLLMSHASSRNRKDLKNLIKRQEKMQPTDKHTGGAHSHECKDETSEESMASSEDSSES